MVTKTIALQRLYQQQLVQVNFKNPEDVVSWFGAVQGQDYYGVQWSLGMRMQNATDAIIEQAFNAGRILRTHMMRPTWHLVIPEDIRFIMKATAHRVHAANTYMYRKLELDEALLAKSHVVIAQALEGGKNLTRDELGAKLAEVAIVTDGLRLAYIIMHAELELLICSGSRRGKQFTYALLDERAPHGKAFDQDEALAELTKRYFTGHGPATVYDFAWWSGLTLKEVKTGIEMCGSALRHEEIDDNDYYFVDSVIDNPTTLPRAYLLPTYDELVIGFDSSQRATRLTNYTMTFDSTIVIDGQIVGSWKRILQKKEVVIELAPSVPLGSSEVEAIHHAIDDYARFIGMSIGDITTLS